jgi:predicted enzyme related to lactoylglutathione lyase
MDYVKANGGTICFGPQDVHGMGEFALCVDPQGAAFAIFEFKQQ